MRRINVPGAAIVAAAVIVILQFIATPVQASPVTYVYTGNQFTWCTYGCAANAPANWASDYIIASISFNAPLAPNMPLTDLTASLTAWTLRDALGYFSYSSSDPDTAGYLTGIPPMGVPPLALSTDGNGDIASYLMSAFPAEAFGKVGSTEAGIFNPPISEHEVPGGYIASFFNINWGLSTEWDAGTGAPGTWAPVPEPATLALTGLGLAVIVIRHRRRRSRSET